MATSFVWYGITSSGTTVALSGTSIGFFGREEGSPYGVGTWNSSTNVCAPGGDYLEALNNTKSGSTALPVIQINQLPLMIQVNMSTWTSINAVLYADNGAGASTTGAVIMASEISGSAWIPLGPAASYLGATMANQGSAYTHNYYVALTASPTVTGAHPSNRLVFVITYGGLPT